MDVAKLVDADPELALLRARYRDAFRAAFGHAVARLSPRERTVLRLTTQSASALVQQSLLFFHGQRYCIVAWVIMPNHVHVLFQPREGWSVAKIVASWKKFTAMKICAQRRAAGNANLRFRCGS